MIDRNTALALDSADPLAHFRKQFLIADEDQCYLDGNSLGRLPKATVSRMAEFLRDGWGRKVVDGWSDWVDLAEQVGNRVGKAALGAAPGQTLVMDTTSINLYRACRAAIAARPGRNTIISDTANFPTDRYILEGIAAELGMNLVLIPNEVQAHAPGEWVSDELVTSEILSRYLKDDVALVSLSVVQYRSGARHNVRELTDLARSHGALFVWDAAHAVGAIDLDFDADGVDLAVGCTYKYGNSGPGAPAWIYLRRELQSEIDLPIHGWFAQRNQFAMGQGFSRTSGMRGFQIASPGVPALLCVDTAFAMIAQAGMTEIEAKARRGTELMIDLFDMWLAPLGYELLTPRDSSLRGGHITIYHPEAERIARGIRTARNVVPDYRAPNGIRLGISPLPTSYLEVYDGFVRLRDYTQSREWEQLSATPPKVT